VNAQEWQRWTQKQMAELGRHLQTQGYASDDIQRLTRTVPQFAHRLQALIAEVDRLSAETERYPERYRYFDEIGAAIRSFLSYTGEHRANLLTTTPLAETA